MPGTLLSHRIRSNAQWFLSLPVTCRLRAHYPYWDRRGGRDHIWLVTHDEASCYVPAVVRPSIILSECARSQHAASW